MIKPHEVRALSEKEISQRIKDNLEALDKIKFQKAVGGEVKNPVQVRFLKKEIAEMRTILREREIEAKKNAGAVETKKNEGN
ncbi:MAG TPA: 50S ribosomal protein L29 [Candidatus Kryptonia bacterium]